MDPWHSSLFGFVYVLSLRIPYRILGVILEVIDLLNSTCPARLSAIISRLRSPVGGCGQTDALTDPRTGCGGRHLGPVLGPRVPLPGPAFLAPRLPANQRAYFRSLRLSSQCWEGFTMLNNKRFLDTLPPVVSGSYELSH